MTISGEDNRIKNASDWKLSEMAKNHVGVQCVNAKEPGVHYNRLIYFFEFLFKE